MATPCLPSTAEMYARLCMPHRHESCPLWRMKPLCYVYTSTSCGPCKLIMTHSITGLARPAPAVDATRRAIIVMKQGIHAAGSPPRTTSCCCQVGLEGTGPAAHGNWTYNPCICSQTRHYEEQLFSHVPSHGCTATPSVASGSATRSHAAKAIHRSHQCYPQQLPWQPAGGLCPTWRT